jgi:calcium/calmodulin-dependent protein kinase I
MSDVPAAPIDGLKLSPDIEGKHIKTPGQTLLCETAPSTLKFDNDYKVKERLSQGSFGTVYVTQHIPTGEEFAVKVIDRKRLSKKDNDAVSREVSVLKDCVDVQHIVRLVDFYVSPSTFYVVQMYARGGDVFERLATRASYTEKDARFLAVHLLEAMRVLHSRKMAHRDLKPENLLLRDVLDDSGILVADFGFARYVPEDKLKTRCGTRELTLTTIQ